MNHERHLVVTEARLGLSLLTCLLFMLGYMILSRLNESGPALSEDAHPGYAVQPASAIDDAPNQAAEQPQVLAVERSDSPAPVVHTSARPDESEGAESALQPRAAANLR